MTWLHPFITVYFPGDWEAQQCLAHLNSLGVEEKEARAHFHETTVRSSLERAFLAFHAKNPHVYELFKRFAFEAMNFRKRHFSGRFILERIRWEVMITTTDAEFKLNDHHSPYYTRKFISEYPQYRDCFELRRVHGDSSAA